MTTKRRSNAKRGNKNGRRNERGGRRGPPPPYRAIESDEGSGAGSRESELAAAIRVIYTEEPSAGYIYQSDRFGFGCNDEFFLIEFTSRLSKPTLATFSTDDKPESKRKEASSEQPPNESGENVKIISVEEIAFLIGEPFADQKPSNDEPSADDQKLSKKPKKKKAKKKKNANVQEVKESVQGEEAVSLPASAPVIADNVDEKAGKCTHDKGNEQRREHVGRHEEDSNDTEKDSLNNGTSLEKAVKEVKGGERDKEIHVEKLKRVIFSEKRVKEIGWQEVHKDKEGEKPKEGTKRREEKRDVGGRGRKAEAICAVRMEEREKEKPRGVKMPSKAESELSAEKKRSGADGKSSAKNKRSCYAALAENARYEEMVGDLNLGWKAFTETGTAPMRYSSLRRQNVHSQGSAPSNAQSH